MKDSNAAPSTPKKSVPDSETANGSAPTPESRTVANANANAEQSQLTVARIPPSTPQIAKSKSVGSQAQVAAVAAKSDKSGAPKPGKAKVAGGDPARKRPAVPQFATAAASKTNAPVAKTAVKTAGARIAETPATGVKARRLALRPAHIAGIVVLLALTGAAGASVGAYNNWKNSRIIAPKVRIAGEPVGGLTRDTAAVRLNERFGKVAFTLQTDDGKIVLGLSDVGGTPSVKPTVDKAFGIGRGGGMVHNFMRVFGSEVKPRSFPLPVEWNRGALTSRLKIVNKQYARPAVDARLITVRGGAPRVRGEAMGRAIDVSATADAIQKSYYLGKSKVEAVTVGVAPKVAATDLAGRDVKLGEYRTNYNGGIAGRTTNIHVACRAVDGQVFMPGEVLSFNGLTGERTYKKGYRMAHIFLREKGQTESQVVDGLAGGVCQVSSTLYNAVRKTNASSAGKPLQIVERNSHSLPVTYVPSGRDATVAWPGKDFKFRNAYNFPIYLRTDAGKGRLTISIWGRVPDNQAMPVSLEN